MQILWQTDPWRVFLIIGIVLACAVLGRLGTMLFNRYMDEDELYINAMYYAEDEWGYSS